MGDAQVNPPDGLALPSAARWLRLLAPVSLIMGIVALTGCLLLPHAKFYRVIEGIFGAGEIAVILGWLVLTLLWYHRGWIWVRSVAWLGLAAAGLALLIDGYVAVDVIKTSAVRMQSMNNLKQIALAFHDYHDEHGRFPPAALLGKDGEPLLSWRVLLLPYLEQDDLYKEFHLDEPWDSPHNLALLPRMPKIYSWPGPQPPGPFETFYQVVVGPGAAFDGPQGRQMPGDFPDGTGDTFFVVEATEAVPWTKPADLTYDPNSRLPALGGPSPPSAAWYEVPRSPNFNVALVDGSCRHFSRRDVSVEQIRAWITRNGGEPKSD